MLLNMFISQNFQYINKKYNWWYDWKLKLLNKIWNVTQQELQHLSHKKVISTIEDFYSEIDMYVHWNRYNYLYHKYNLGMDNKSCIILQFETKF